MALPWGAGPTHLQNLTWKLWGWRWGSAPPVPRCHPSERWHRRGPPRTSCSTAHSLETAVRPLEWPLTPQHWGAEGLRPHPNICSLIDDALAGHREEFRGTVGDGAALGSPVLQRGRGDAGLVAVGRFPPTLSPAQAPTCTAMASRELVTSMRARFMEPRSIRIGWSSSSSSTLVGLRSLQWEGDITKRPLEACCPHPWPRTPPVCVALAVNGLQPTADAMEDEKDALLWHEGSFLPQRFHLAPQGPPLAKIHSR